MSRTLIDGTLIPSAFLNTKNLLINGGMEVWQRNTTFTTPASGIYTADRWLAAYDGTPTFTVSREASIISSGTFAMKVQITATGGSTGFNMRQIIEDFAQFKGKTITFSMRINANVSNVKLLLNDGFTSTASNAHSGGGAYETLTVTKTCDAATSQMICYFGFVDSSPSVSIIYGDSAMLTIGSTIIPFSPADPAIELAQCQRYFQYVGGTSGDGIAVLQATATNQTLGPIRFRVRMRAAPTVTVNNQTNFEVRTAAGAVVAVTVVSTTGTITVDGIRLTTTNTASLVAGNATELVTNNANATIFFAAEL